MEKKNQLPILDFYLNDWVFAIPMTLLLLVAIALVIWRLLLNHGASSNLDVLLPDIQENLKRKGLPAAVSLCQTEHGLIPNQMFVAGLEASEQGVAAMRRSMAAAAEHEILPRLNFLMPTILAIAKISTMVGLFGTVVSMIGTFGAISNPEGGAAGAGAMAAQSKKIGLALFATAYGLITAIPLVFCHVLFKAWIAKFEVRMKVAAQKLITLVQKVKSGEDDDDEDDDRDRRRDDEDDDGPRRNDDDDRRGNRGRGRERDEGTDDQRRNYSQGGKGRGGGNLESKKMAAGLLGVFAGSLGIHKFYLGYSNAGVIQIVITVVTAGMGGIIGFIEGIIYLTKSDNDFIDTYQRGEKQWF